MGDVGADIFCREVPGQWTELYPFANHKSLKAAMKLGLSDNSRQLAGMPSQKNFPRFIAALLRVGVKRDYDLSEEVRPSLNAHQLMCKSQGKLYEMAHRQSGHGRSTMNKKELLTALSH